MPIDLRTLAIREDFVASLRMDFDDDRRSHLIRACAATLQYRLTTEALPLSALDDKGNTASCVVVSMPADVWRIIVGFMEIRQP